MRVICGKTVAILAIVLGLPLLIIGCEGDAKAATPPAKCDISGVYVNKTGNGWLGFTGSFVCKNHKPGSARATFQILRSGEVWRVMNTMSSPIQFDTRCRRGGQFVEFRGRLSVSVQNANGRTQRFVKTGMVHHWRCTV